MLRTALPAVCLLLFVTADSGYTQDVILEPLASGLSSPVYMTTARDGTDRKFIVEQQGRILVLQPDSSTPAPFLDIVDKVLSGGERGLLGLAFHPQFPQNRFFFVNYTRQPDGATVVARYSVLASDPNRADPASEVVFLTIDQPFANHNGGMIEFGPDNFLYIGMGDGGSGNDPQNRAQNPDDLLGKILRIDVDNPSGGVPYSSPQSNPFFGAAPGRDEIFALGLRNPYRFSFDRSTGELYGGDVGQNAREEIDIITLGGNYGWRVFEGTLCTNLGPESCATLAAIPPIAEYGHEGGRCSVTGGYVYRGTRSTLPAGAYIFGDFCSGEIFMFQNGVQTVLADTELSISSFAEDESGEIYVISHGGTISRIAGSIPAQVSQAHFSAPQRGLDSLPTARVGLPFAAGYSWLLGETGKSLPHSLALLSSEQNGILIAESAIPASQPVRAGRIPAIVDESAVTGVAFANPNTSDVTVAFYFTNSAGSDSELRRITIPARRHMAAFFDEEPFLGDESLGGTFTFMSSEPVAALALSGTINRRAEFIFTALPIASLTSLTTEITTIPHWEQGGDRRTEFVLVNPSDQAVTGELRLLTSEGLQWDLLPYSIPAKSSRRLSSAIVEPAPRSGSARIVPAEGPSPTAFALLQTLSGDGPVTQSAIPAIMPGTTFLGFGDAAAAIETHVAVANTSSSPATVTVELTGPGANEDARTGTIQLPAFGQSSLPLPLIPGVGPLTVPFQRAVRVSSSAPIAVTLLRHRQNQRGETLITELTPMDESSAVPAAQLYYPHLAVGDGFEMEFLFVNSQREGTQTGRIFFFGEEGGQLPVTLQQRNETGVCREQRRSRWSSPIRVCS